MTANWWAVIIMAVLALGVFVAVADDNDWLDWASTRRDYSDCYKVIGDGGYTVDVVCPGE